MSKMRSPVAGPPDIRRAQVTEARQLSAIAVAAKRHWGYPDEWVDTWRNELTVTAGFIESQDVFVAVGSQGELLGFYAVCLADVGAELEHFWVCPNVIGRGVGRALFEHAVARARAMGAPLLHVDSDPHAAGFYERMGAVLVGEVSAPMDGRPRLRPQYELNLRVR